MKHITESYISWQHAWADKMRLQRFTLLRDFLAETFGMMTFVAFSTGLFAQAKITSGSLGTLMDLTIGRVVGWVIGLSIAGSSSPGLCNPCIAFMNMLVGRVDPLRMLVFWLAELIGSILGALLVMAIYYEKLESYTAQCGNGELLMNCTGDIFVSTANNSIGSLVIGQIIIGIFTFASVMAILDKNIRDLNYFHVILYLTIPQFLLADDFMVQSTSILNPAFDFGGRIALAMTGFGSKPFTYINHSFWVFLIMPFVGALLGLLTYELFIGIHLPGAGQRSDYEERDPTLEYDDSRVKESHSVY